MTLGHGMVYSFSSKQKINMRSSTKCELVGMNDAVTNIVDTIFPRESRV